MDKEFNSNKYSKNIKITFIINQAIYVTFIYFHKNCELIRTYNIFLSSYFDQYFFEFKLIY